MTLAAGLDLAAVAVFALTGGLVASRAQLDLVGFVFLACLTGVGGGTLRDLLLGRDPVFWVADPAPLAVACIAALVVYLAAHRLESRHRVLLWLDAVALSVAVAAGVSVARGAEAAWPIVLVMAVVTGTVGGLLRDVVANEMPMVLRQRELYVTAAFAGATAGVVADALAMGQAPAALAAALVTFALRAGSLAFGWRLPVYRPRPPRTDPPRR
jgi:uncharacterized membrane protein YeiH